MKKVYLFMVSCSLVSGIVSAQATFQWGKAEGKWAYDYGYGINTDASGNVYVAGKYEEDGAHFSGSTVTCQGNHDSFLAKYNPNGDLQWVHTMGGPDGDYAEALSTDKTSCIIVSGEIENKFHNSPNTISFSNSTITLAAQGDNDAFLAKYDLNGNLVWAVDEGHGTNSEKGLGNAIDKDGNVYMCGYFTDATVFNGTTYTGAGGRDIYVAKYNSAGQFQWFRHAGSVGRDEAKAAVCDAQGNVYITGGYDKNCAFGTQTLSTFNNTDWWDVFIAKYDKDGNLQWVKTGGGDVDDIAWSITIDNAGSLYIGGETAAWAMFGSSTHTILANGEADSFIAKYNQNGDVQWVKNGGSDKVDRIRAIGTDGTNVLATGQFGGTASFGQYQATAVDTSDIFITVISPDGTWGFLTAAGGKPDSVETLGYESGNAVTGTPSGEVYATGGLLDGGIFGPSNVSGYKRTDAFVAKLKWSGSVGVPEYARGRSALQLFPNPAKDVITVDIRAMKKESATISMFNCVGAQVLVRECGESGTNLDLREYAPGVYFVQVDAGDVTETRRIIITH